VTGRQGGDSLSAVQTPPEAPPDRRTTSRAVPLCVLAAAFLLLVSTPATAVTVGLTYRPPQLLLHFDRHETRRVAGAADTGFTPFVTTLCLMLPGGRRMIPINAACLVSTTTSYSRLMPIFRDARRRGRCVRISYPVGFPLPNPAPYSRVEACR
jgi:hypothetical protein